MGIYFLMWVILLILMKFHSSWPLLLKIKSGLHKALMWNESINFFNSQFTPLMLSSMNNLYDMRYNGLLVSKISAYFSILAIIATVGSLIAIIILLFRLSKNMNQEKIKEFNNKYSPLTSEIRETKLSRLVIFWKVLNLIRLLLTLIILTFLSIYPTLQMQILLIFSLVQQCLILSSRPYKTTSLNILSFFNELSVSIYLYLALLLSDYLDS